MTAEMVLYSGILLCGLGMMLVIAGVIAAGWFLPGVVLILIGMIACAAAGVMAVLPRRAAP